MQTIEVVVARDGTSRVETSGCTGSNCRQASEFLEHALGSRSSERLKPVNVLNEENQIEVPYR